MLIFFAQAMSAHREATPERRWTAGLTWSYSLSDCSQTCLALSQACSLVMMSRCVLAVGHGHSRNIDRRRSATRCPTISMILRWAPCRPRLTVGHSKTRNARVCPQSDTGIPKAEASVSQPMVFRPTDPASKRFPLDEPRGSSRPRNSRTNLDRPLQLVLRKDPLKVFVYKTGV